MQDRKEFEFQLESLEQRTMLSGVQIFAAGDLGDEAFELIIKGEKQATYNLHGTQPQVFTFNPTGSVTADDIRIQFINDKFEPENGIDRNLRIDKIVVNGVTFQTEAPSTFSTGTWKAEDGITPGFRQSEVLNGNGFFQFSSGSKTTGSDLKIRVQGDEGTEQFNLIIKGQVVGTFNATTQAQTISFQTAEVIQASDVRIEFINDRFDPANGIDANLTVDFISIDGKVYQTEAPNVFSTGTWRAEDGITPGFRQSETLNGNGFFQFGADPNGGGGVTGSEIQIRVRGDEGTERFNLLIQGQVVRTFNVTTTDQTIIYRHTGTVTADDVRIEFINDVFDPANGIDANLIVDFISIDGTVFQTEAPSVFSTGTWRPEDGITPGFRQSEMLNGNGFFQYSSVRPPAPNQNPVAAPDRFTVVQGETLRGNVAANDSDPDGDRTKLVYRLATQPAFGQITFNADGTFVYVANSNQFGETSFTYTVTDERGGVSTGVVTLAVNQPANQAPVAAPDRFTVVQGETLRGNVAANDSDPDGDRTKLVYRLATQPAFGQITFNSDGTFVYVANSSNSGEIKFTYSVIDERGGSSTGEVTLTVSQRPNQAPVATPDRFTVTQGQTVSGNVGANDSDPDGDNARLVYRLATQPAFGQLTFNSDGSFAYVAGANNTGETQFTYTVTDERGGTSTGQVTIAVNARVLAPVEITVPSQGGVATGVVWELRNIDVSGTKKNPFPNSTSGISTRDLAGGSFTIKLGTTPVAVGIVDNDGRFEDGDLKQVLANNVTINGVFEAAGKRFTPEYSYRVQEASTGRIVNIYVVELGSNKAVGIVADAPLQTGVAYTFISLTSNTPKDLAYNNLADSYIILA